MSALKHAFKRMKVPATDWKKIFTNHISEKTYPNYVKNLQH